MPFASDRVDPDASADLAAALRRAAGDLDAVVRIAAETIGAAHPVETHLWLLDLDGEHLEAEAWWAPGRTVLPGTHAFIDLERHGLAHVRHATGPVRAGGVPLPPQWNLGDASDVLFVPLAIGGRRPGLLVVVRPAGQPPLSADDELDARELAERLALLVDHARLVTGAARSSLRQRGLRRIGEHALAAGQVDDLERRVIEDIRHAMDADAAIVYRVLPDGLSGLVTAQVGMPELAAVGTVFPLSDSTLALIAAGDHGAAAVDVDSMTYTNSLSAAVGLDASCKIVLRPQDGPVLVLGVGRSAPRMFAGPERRFLESAGHLLTVGLDLRTTHARLRREATADALTGLPNRAMLYERLKAEVARSRVATTSMALVLADLDEFKLVNDSMGHTEGDRFLATVSARLAAVVRPGDLVARLGGDEFAVVCAGVDERGAVAIAERVLHALGGPVALAHRHVVPRASIGVAVHDATVAGDVAAPADVAATLVQHADVAMYRSKAAGGNRVTVYDVALDELVRRRLAIEQGLRAALAAGTLTLAYQPIVDLDTGSIRSIETLVRWHDDELGHVSPAEFIPVAEQSDLVCDLDAWVLRTAAAQLVTWMAAGLAVPDRIGVNLSARNFDDPGLAARLARVLDEVRCPPERVLVEITESLLTEGVGPAAVGELLGLGLDVAIDDFGAGFSSLAQLKRVPVTYLKIDRGFVDGILSDPTDVAIVRSTLALARELGKAVVAEGVETPEQLRELHRLGCHIVQGYLLGRPSDAATMTRWLTDGLDVSVAELLATP